MREHKQHHYTTTLSWRGSTGLGYEKYRRGHEMAAPPAKVGLQMSSDPAFRGDPALLNPEQLLVMAASSCQMLSFLAIAARKRVNVVEYDDQAEGFMPEDDKPVRITRILLKPRIVVETPADPAALQKMVELAHKECFIANSLKTQVDIEPQIMIIAL